MHLQYIDALRQFEVNCLALEQTVGAVGHSDVYSSLDLHMLSPLKKIEMKNFFFLNLKNLKNKKIKKECCHLLHVSSRYDELNYVKPMTADFIAWEEYGRFGYTYNATMKEVRSNTTTYSFMHYMLQGSMFSVCLTSKQVLEFDVELSTPAVLPGCKIS